VITLDFITIFPRVFDVVLGEGVFRVAAEKSLVSYSVFDLRDFTNDRHRTVDDAPYGGGPGMILKVEPIWKALKYVLSGRGDVEVIVPSPQGEPFSQVKAAELAGRDGMVMVAGHYKAIDERVFELFPVKEFSLGDYVLSGGELASLVIADAVVRLVPGVLGDEDSAAGDSFASGMLDCGYYTRPEVFEGLRVPEELLSGNHRTIAEWRRRDALRRTYLRRPDLIEGRELSEEDRSLLKRIVKEEDR